MKNLINILNTILEDDNTANGGVSFKGETLRNFLDETGIDYNASMEEINNALVECGIKPIINEKQKENYTLDYLNQHLLDCETGMNEIFINVRGFNESIEVVDVIGIVEEKGRIFVGLEVEYEEYCYLVNVNFMNTWDFVYKDEMVEIQDVLSNMISAQLKTDLGLKDNILDDVKYWLKETTNGDQKEEINMLDHLITYGTQNVAPNHLIYNDDIQSYYKEHREEINNIVEEETGYTIDDAIDDLDAFEIVINNVGGLDSELEFENSHELENSELRWFVWLAFERVAYEYLETLESE